MPVKKYIVKLSEQERTELTTIVNKGKGDANRIKHAHILLKADEGWKDEKIAETFGCHSRTVENIRQRLVTEGLTSALERKKRKTPPRETIIDGDAEARLLKLACGEAPDGHARWTMQLLADKMVELEIVQSVGRETVRQTLKKMSLNRICESAG